MLVYLNPWAKLNVAMFGPVVSVTEDRIVCRLEKLPNRLRATSKAQRV